jgi:hypothetical protein
MRVDSVQKPAAPWRAGSGGTIMAGKGGASHEHTQKAKRMAEHIEESAKKEGRYKGREEEVAWRTVHKEMAKEEREK